MSDLDSVVAQYGPHIETLVAAMAGNSKTDFLDALDDIVRIRERDMFFELRKLTTDLQSALERFRLDSRLVDLAEKEVPDARQRLDHVLKMTDDAAHKTLDLVERSGPLAERTGTAAADLIVLWRGFVARTLGVEEFRILVTRMDKFLTAARADSNEIRSNLSEVLMAQGYQDLSGQIIRGVMKLVLELETALVDLVRLSASHRPEREEKDQYVDSRGYGPAVPGINNGAVVGDQQDVDALLSGLGM
jgi:chemotaxis protein CheZ